MRSDSPDTLVWLPVSNAAGETIPAFAAMRVTGVDSDGIFTVAKPNADSAVTNIMFNGPVEIESGLYGHGTFGIPCSARYDTADGTPSNGDEWGVESGGWKLRNAKLGFKIQGSTDSSNGVATVVRNLDAAAAGGGLDISGRSGSVADVTAAQFLRTVASGTAGATVVTPDDASASLPGDVNLSDQKLGMGRKTVEELGIGESAFGTTMRLYQYSAQVIRMQDSAGATQPRLTLPFGGSLQFRSIDDAVEATIFYDNTAGADCLFLTVNGSSAFKIAAPGTTPTSTSLPCVVGSQIIAAQFSADFDGTYAGRKPGATGTVGGMEFAGGLYITGTPTVSSIDGGTF